MKAPILQNWLSLAFAEIYSQNEFVSLTNDFPFASIVQSTLRRRPEFKNGRFAPEQEEMYFVHTESEELKNVTITGHFRFLKKTRSGESHHYREVIVLEKLRFSLVFSVQTKTESRHLQIPPV